MSLSFMRRESKYRKKVCTLSSSEKTSKMFYIYDLSDQESVWKGWQGERGQAGPGSVAESAHQGGLSDLNVNIKVHQDTNGVWDKYT